MQIFINSPCQNQLLVIECGPGDIVSQLKANIETNDGIPVSKQYLTFQCKPLQDNLRLDEYGITDNSMLFLNVRAQGGAEKVIPTGSKEGEAKKPKTTGQQKKDSENVKLQEILKNKITEKRDKHILNLASHEECINSVAVSSDNKYVVSGSSDNSITVLEIETKQEHWPIKNAHENKVNSVAISSDNKFIASASEDRSVKVFDLQNKEVFHHFKNAHTKAVYSVAVSNNNKYVVSGSKDLSIKIFDLTTKQEYHHFKDAHAEAINSVTISSNNKFIISGSDDKSIKVFNLQIKQMHHHFKDAHSRPITSVAVSSDNRFIVSGSYDKSIKVFDLQSKQEIYHFRDAHPKGITSVSISNDNRFIVSGSYDKSIKIFDLQNKQEHHHFKDIHTDFVYSVAFSNDNRFIVSGSADHSIKMFFLRNKQKHSHFKDTHHSTIFSVAVSHDNRFVVSASHDKSIKVFDLNNMQEHYHFKDVHTNAISSVAVTPDNKYIISGSHDNSIKMFDIEGKNEYHHFKDVHTKPINSVAVSNDNKFIVSGSKDYSIKVIDLQTKQDYHHFKCAHEGVVNSVVISNDGGFIISGSNDKSIRIFNIQTKQETYRFKDAHEWPVTSVAVSSDFRFVVSASIDKSLKVFDLQTKHEHHHFKDVHTSNVNSVAMSSDNRFAISASSDRSVKMFDLRTKQEYHNIKDAHTSYVYAVAVSNNGKFIASGGKDRSIRISPIPNIDENEIFYVSRKVPSNSPFIKFDHLFFTSSTPEYFREVITCYQDIYISPYYWTILHLACIFQNPTVISQIPSYSDFKVPFLLDSYGKTPFHYILSEEKIHYPSADIILNYMVDFIEDTTNRTPHELEMIFKSLAPLLQFILSKTNSKVRDRYLQAAFMPSFACEKLPIFGTSQTNYTFSNSCIVYPETKDKIFKEGSEQVMFRTMMLHLDYNASRDDMYDIAWTLLSVNNEEIFKSLLIGHLLNHLWHKAKFVMVIFAIPFWIEMALLSVYFGLGTRVLPLEIIIFGLTIFLLIGEFIQMSTLRKRYFRVAWNWLDVGQILLTLAFFIMVFTDNEKVQALAPEWITSVIIMLGYIRLVSYLRLFKATRNLIQVIVSIMKDMAGFILVLAFIIIGFSLIFLQFNRDNDYSVHLYDTYQVLYGSYETGDAALSQKLLAALILFLLNVVLLNLLISIMGDSYDKVQERRLLTDSITRLEMILEAMAYMRVFNRGKAKEKGFLIYCLAEKDEEENGANNEWEGRINMIRKLIKQNEQKVEEVKDINKEMDKKMDANSKEIEDKMTAMEGKIDALEKKIEAIEKKTESNHQELLKAINQISINK